MPFHWFLTYWYWPLTSQITTPSLARCFITCSTHTCTIPLSLSLTPFSHSFYSFPFILFISLFPISNFIIFFNFSYFVIPMSLLVDYVLYDIYMCSLAYIYIAVFCSVVLQLVYHLDHWSHSCSLHPSCWTQCPPSSLVDPVLCAMTSSSSIPLPLCCQQSWSLQLHPSPPFDIPSSPFVLHPSIRPGSHTHLPGHLPLPSPINNQKIIIIFRTIVYEFSSCFWASIPCPHVHQVEFSWKWPAWLQIGLRAGKQVYAACLLYLSDRYEMYTVYTYK